MLLRVCFVASYLQKYGCIRLDSFSYKTQNVSLVLVSAEKASLVPQEKSGGVQFRVWGWGSMVSPMSRPLFFSCSTIHSLLLLPHHFNTAATVQASFSHKHRKGRLIIFRSPLAQLFIRPKARPGPMATQTQRKLRPSALSRRNE